MPPPSLPKRPRVIPSSAGSHDRSEAPGGDAAYVLPMAAFLALLFVGEKWPALKAWAYVGRVVISGGLLLYFRPRYTRVRWNGWWLGPVLGVVGVVQWVAMQRWLAGRWEFFQFAPDPFDPYRQITSGWVWTYGFIAFRVVGAAVVVPFMEELFWRDWLWRKTIAPADFRLAAVGSWDLAALLFVTAAFASVHGQCWLVAVVWGLMIGGLLVWTRSLGACIVMHATTNALLAAYVLQTGDWAFW